MIGTRIRYYRKRSGYTLEQLADGICSVSYLSKFEHGEKASDEIIQLLCKRLGISYEDVDNKEELDRINRLLDEWYMEIRNRNNEGMITKEDQVTNLIKEIEEPILILKYDLFKLRKCLIEYKFEEANTFLVNIEKFKDIFTKELEYFYFHFKGVYLFMNENYEQTIEHFLKAEEILTNMDFSEEETAEIWYQIGLTYAYYYQVTKCINYAYKALGIFEKHYIIRRIADCQTLLGISNRRIHNHQQAKFHYEQALKFITLLNDEERKGIIYHNLGYIASLEGDSQKAIDYFNKSLSFESNQGSKSHTSTIHLIAREFFRIKEIDKSLKWIEKGLNSVVKSEFHEFFYLLTILRYEINSDSKLIDFIKKDALPYFKKIKKWDHVTNYSEKLANHYYNIGKYKSASQYYRLANNSRKKIQ